jgi:3-oxoacyl-[acyl-carrier protein] reductase
MLLENKSAVIYGAGGAIGGAVARTFAREGARLFLAGRTLATLDAVARDIAAAGGAAETAQVDALDEPSIQKYIAAVAKKAGGIDVSFNAIPAICAFPRIACPDQKTKAACLSA